MRIGSLFGGSDYHEGLLCVEVAIWDLLRNFRLDHPFLFIVSG